MAYRDHWLAKPLALVLVKYTIPLQGRVTNRLCPTGKSLRVFRNGCPAPFAKIFCFASDPNQFTDRTVPSQQRGVRTSRTWGGMRWTRAADVTNGADAYGQVVSF